MTIIESVTRFIMSCPFLNELARVNVDFLPADPDTYSVEEVPSETIRKKYLERFVGKAVYVHLCGTAQLQR